MNKIKSLLNKYKLASQTLKKEEEEFRNIIQKASDPRMKNMYRGDLVRCQGKQTVVQEIISDIESIL